jgi:surface polysaccharide O-acyltransferase-like enzyme
MLRRINISAVLIVFVCFFLPWEQVSCGGARDTLNGLDLARHDHPSLWLIPLMMLAVLVVGFIRRQVENARLLSIVNLISGVLAAYLMNNERLRVHDDSGIISVQLTGWFWLAFLSSLAMIVTALAMLLKRQRAP